ncbi:MAG: plasmid mobilization protein [Gammaproteobacteria bacterium]
MKTERMTILVTPDEKAAINARAESLRIPAAEFVRRAVADYDPNLESAELVALADELERVVESTEEKVDDALRTLQAFRDFMGLSDERKLAQQA